MTDELLIDLAETGRRLGLCRRSIQSLIYNGSLPSVRIGRARRVVVADLIRYVELLREENDREGQNLAAVEGGHGAGLSHSG